MRFVWVFHGSGGQFASGVFSSRENAEAWIASDRLSGLLTRYALDIGACHWAIEQGTFKPKLENSASASFIQKFANGSVHYHYEDGECVA